MTMADSEKLFLLHMALMELGSMSAGSFATQCQKRGWPLPDFDRTPEALSVIAPMLVLNGLPSPDIIEQLSPPYPDLYVNMLNLVVHATLEVDLPPDELRNLKIAIWGFMHIQARAPESQADWDSVQFLVDLFTGNREAHLQLAEKLLRKAGKI